MILSTTRSTVGVKKKPDAAGVMYSKDLHVYSWQENVWQPKVWARKHSNQAAWVGLHKLKWLPLEGS
jgi:hypothetical protein